MRHLSRKVVKAQSGDEADNPVRHSFSGLRQTMMFRRLCISRNVQTASHSPYETLIGGKPQVLARYSSAIKVARSEDTRPTNHPGYKISLRGCHLGRVYNMSVDIYKSRHIVSFDRDFVWS